MFHCVLVFQFAFALSWRIHIALLRLILTIFAVFGGLNPVNRSFAADEPTDSRIANSRFVTRTGSRLMLDGKQYRFGGANIYWMGITDNIQDERGPTYPTKFQIQNALEAAARMNHRVIRVHTMGISVGCERCLVQGIGQYNREAFETIDYSLQKTAELNLKLIIPLTDQWRYYHGGKWTWVHWASESDSGEISDTNPDLVKNAANDTQGPLSEQKIEQQFYTNESIKRCFKQYITDLLNHSNPLTGLKLKNDPAILAWETGNEIWDAPVEWTDEIARHIKLTVGAKQLVADGSAASGHSIANAAVNSNFVDIVGGHFYNWPNGLDVDFLTQEADIAAKHAKVYVVGEYGWSIKDRKGFLDRVAGHPAIAGDLFWSILPYRIDGSYVEHGSKEYGEDDVSLYFPGIDSRMKDAIRELTDHAARMARAE